MVSVLNRNELFLYKMTKMNGKLLLIPTVLVVFSLQFSCRHTNNVREAEVAIIDVGDSSVPEPNLAGHVAHNLVVYRSTPVFTGCEYNVQYYQEEKGILVSHQAGLEVEDTFDRAQYRWIDDTTVSISLYSTTTKKEHVFKVFGHGSSSGMTIE